MEFVAEEQGEQALLRNLVPSGLATAPAYVENALASTIVMARRMTREPVHVEARSDSGRRSMRCWSRARA